ncbi:MAG TPA: efflux RND transporter permease subunit, partial [Pirellulaceae bacterium]|nr:efflux RND transporter permease subunit [Pirellulaceae bacterium]
MNAPKSASHSHDESHAAPLDPLSRLVKIFLDSNLSIILIVVSLLLGGAALFVTPREEDPQIVVPLADVFVQFPGHSAREVEQLVAAPLERMLYQIDGVEYVYSMSRADQAVITVRFYVGQDRERSLVKLFKKLNENVDRVAPGVAGWVVKPVELDDVPIVTLALTSDSYDSHSLRRVGEELVERLATVPQVSRAQLIGGEPRAARVTLDAERLRGRQLSPLEVVAAVRGANVKSPAGRFNRDDSVLAVEAGGTLVAARDLRQLVVGVYQGAPVFLSDVAEITDGPEEPTTYVRHGFGPARGFTDHADSPGVVIGVRDEGSRDGASRDGAPHETTRPAVTIAVAKQKGSNAVHVARAVLAAAERLRDEIVPDDVDLVITRNNGLTANEKVNELIEALGVAILIVILLLTLSMGWREALVVAVAVPVVFGLTLAVNLLFGYTINRVTLFALILALGLLVDDPIVDVENIARHFEERKNATRDIVLQAVAEIRPPLISATLAVIVSFLPLFFITGMMGPYMSPMALNVPVSMLMSMLVAFTITPWLSYHALRKRFSPSQETASAAGAKASGAASGGATVSDATSTSEHASTSGGSHELYDVEAVQRSLLYRMFRPMMVQLLKSRWRSVGFLVLMAALTVGATAMAALRWVPLKMLPFDNKNELLIVLDMDEGTTVERTRAVVAEFEELLAEQPEVTDFTSYAGVAGPIDFNGLVRHYYLRDQAHLAELRVNFVGKKHRRLQSHGLALRMRNELQQLAERHGAKLQVVELPPGPPVLASLVAEIYGGPEHSYDQLLAAADRVSERMAREPGVVDVDDVRERSVPKWVFDVDQEKAALAGVSAAEIAESLRIAVEGDRSLVLRQPDERNPLRIVFRLPVAERSHLPTLSQIEVRGAGGARVPLGELGKWRESRVDQTIYHKNLRPVVYVYGETVGRPPAECVVDIEADRRE